MSGLKENGWAGMMVPVLSAMVRAAEVASGVKASRCHGNAFGKESHDASSSEGGFLASSWCGRSV